MKKTVRKISGGVMIAEAKRNSVLQVRLRARERKSFEAAACRDGVTLSEWVRSVLITSVPDHYGQRKLFAPKPAEGSLF